MDFLKSQESNSPICFPESFGLRLIKSANQLKKRGDMKEKDED